MKVLDVLGVRVEMPTNHPIVLLRERDGDRYLPIWIGAAEATAIAYAQQGIEPPRPLTHDLLKNVIEGLGHRLTEVRIVELKDGVFHAALVFDGGGRDLVALLRRHRPGAAHRHRDRHRREPPRGGGRLDGAEEDDDEVEKFKEFLDHVSAEDFDKPGEESGT